MRPLRCAQADAANEEKRMTILNGAAVPHEAYLDQFRQLQGAPVVWKWDQLSDHLQDFSHSERGTLALTIPSAREECDIVPGISMTLQVVKPGEGTRPHTHSWWHLYIVRSGQGWVALGPTGSATQVGAGDVILIPAWSSHSFDNRAAQEDLILMRLQNLPQQARLDNLASQEPERPLTFVNSARAA
jgi:gentisate 1,2-dioxygenase